jgi:hypothetical protein
MQTIISIKHYAFLKTFYIEILDQPIPEKILFVDKIQPTVDSF